MSEKRTAYRTRFAVPDLAVEGRAQPLFDMQPHNPTNWKEKVRSASFDERQIVKWIMQLYNQGQPFDADVTYSTGHIWYDLPQPRLKFDLYPQSDRVIAADARHIPINGASVGSMIVDPPFVVAPTMKPGIIRERFGHYQTIETLWAFYAASLSESYRVLRPNGILAFKCQDNLSNSGQHWSHLFVMNTAQEVGFICDDLFVLLSDRVLWSPNMAHQQHARKIHSYYLVFRKPKGKKP